MSTDDSISDDVSSSAALSHCQVSADGGKESEASMVSSEGISTVSEDRQTGSQTTGGTVQYRLKENPIRDMCLTPEMKNLPFINPSSIETLRALVQEIRSSGETDPELWKDCESRWLHLFQLVEKQYQEQILAQQEQYQCQIQLIQDEIKALVQIQNRQTPVYKTLGAEDRDSPGDSTHCSDQTGPDLSRAEVQLPTALSSGYGTMCVWDRTENNQQQKSSTTEEPGVNRDKHQHHHHHPPPPPPPSVGPDQQLTSWAQRNKLRQRKTRTLAMKFSEDDQLHKNQTTDEKKKKKSTDSLDQPPPAALRRSDSLVSEASGLTYWRLHESELYHPLPDSFDSGLPHLREDSSSFVPRALTLKEIYCNKHSRRVDRDGSSLSPQLHAFTLDPVTTRQSDRTSGFTSPSHFSSPSMSTPSHLRAETPISPDSHNPGDTDCISDASSVSAHAALKVQDQWRSFSGTHRDQQKDHQELQELQELQDRARTEGSSAVDDPVVFSLLRQNLRQKHSRHVADLKAYYEAEIQNLVDRLQLKDLPPDVDLSQRCKHLEEALADATDRIRDLEKHNSCLQRKLADWTERSAVAEATVKSLQKRLEENKLSAKDKDTLVVHLKSRVKHLEEAALEAKRESDERESKRNSELKMFQELLGEYDGLLKEHHGLKNNQVSTENKLISAQDLISELKRTISKLESQIKQLEHENQAKSRHPSHGPQPSGAGLFHHPDLLLSPTKGSSVPDVTRTQVTSCFRFKDKPSGRETEVGWRSVSECESSPSRIQEQSSRQKEVSRKPGSSVLTPMMRAIIELEETRATQSRAPWLDKSKSTFGFVEQRLKTPLDDRDLLQDPPKPEKSRVRAFQRSLSPESHRSSSLPPPSHRSLPPPAAAAATPSKRETLLRPLSAKSSPKRCPTENFSTAFGHLLPREEHLQHSPRKRLLFPAAVGDEDPPPDSSPDAEGEELRLPRSLSEVERLFDELSLEKTQIEAALSRIPAGGARAGLQTRLDQVSLEKRLEVLDRDLASLRMTLKKFHVLRSSTNS